MFLICCDGLSDWIDPETIFKTLENNGIKNGINELIPRAKEISLADHNSYDDITAIAVHFR
jgi:serine/threonine protein phosphatase PrpC